MGPERWLRLDLQFSAAVPADDLAYALTEQLIALGGAGVEERDRSWITYFAEPANPMQWMRDSETQLRSQLGPGVSIAWSWQPHEEWAHVWRQGFRAHLIGERLRVAPPWIEGGVSSRADSQEPAERTTIVIDPGVAFGTAEHGSTRACLTLIDRYVSGGEAVLDVGAGSGILSIAALRLGAARAVCVEVDSMAADALLENAERNDVAERIEIINAAFDTKVGAGAYPLVVCNMVRGRVTPLLQELANRVEKEGTLVVGGIEVTEREAFTRDLHALSPLLEPAHWVEDDGWVAVALENSGG